MSVLANGYYYYFLRPSGAHGLGHMGWGFRFAESGWLFGSLENGDGNAIVGADGRNDYWFAEATTEAEMREQMRTMTIAKQRCNRTEMEGYTYYKKIPVTNAKPDDARRVASGQSGYGVLFNNCLDNAAVIGDAYGVQVWSWSRHGQVTIFSIPNFSPNFYFDHTLWQYPRELVATGSSS